MVSTLVIVDLDPPPNPYTTVRRPFQAAQAENYTPALHLELLSRASLLASLHQKHLVMFEFAPNATYPTLAGIAPASAFSRKGAGKPLLRTACLANGLPLVTACQATDDFVVCGCYLDACVLDTATELFAIGPTRIILSATLARDHPNAVANALQSAQMAGVAIMTLAHLVTWDHPTQDSCLHIERGCQFSQQLQPQNVGNTGRQPGFLTDCDAIAFLKATFPKLTRMRYCSHCWPNPQRRPVPLV